MISINKAALCGRVGADPKITETRAGVGVANFSVATVKYSKKENGETEQQTQWHSITTFNEKLIKNIIPLIKKGTKVYLEGELKTSKYVDKNQLERYKTEIILGNFNSILQIESIHRSDGEVESGNEGNIEDYDSFNF